MGKIPPPRQFSKPYRSPLWKYLPRIKQMRKADATWEEILRTIKQEGIELKLSTLFNFYKRYRSRKRPLPYDLRERLDVNPKRKFIPKKEVPKIGEAE